MKNPQTLIKITLQLAALTTFFLGLFIIIKPDLLIMWFDGYSAGDYHIVRFIGTALIGFSVMNWIYSQSKDLKAVLPAIYGNLTSISLAVIVDLIGLATGSLSMAAWLILAVHAVFAGAFIYCVWLIKKL